MRRIKIHEMHLCPKPVIKQQTPPLKALGEGTRIVLVRTIKLAIWHSNIGVVQEVTQFYSTTKMTKDKNKMAQRNNTHFHTPQLTSKVRPCREGEAPLSSSE